MSLQRSINPLTSYSNSIFKFTANAASTTGRTCSRMPRNFTCSSRTYQSSKRELQTATAYHPKTLDAVPPPPRNTGIPNSSIASAVPEVNDTRPPQLLSQYSFPSTSKQGEQQNANITETEAQKTKPVAGGAPSTSSAPQLSSKPKRTKLRARKAAMSLTLSATTQLRNLLALPEPKLIR
ncbi:Iron-sulfur assembly protein 1, partial [Toensbergia leucococca]|nr:Iron-sulfur assembly protein 1 [Toensbergia leucococca]